MWYGKDVMSNKKSSIQPITSTSKFFIESWSRHSYNKKHSYKNTGESEQLLPNKSCLNGLHNPHVKIFRVAFNVRNRCHHDRSHLHLRILNHLHIRGYHNQVLHYVLRSYCLSHHMPLHGQDSFLRSHHHIVHQSYCWRGFLNVII